MGNAVIAVWLFAIGSALAAEPAAPSFTKKPAVSRAGDKTNIEFAVNRECDVAVYVENAKGEVIRHLVAGLLGKNPPEPLKAGTLAQSVEWDGLDDDGKPAADGPFKVRVGLGLKASWGGTAFADPKGANRILHIHGLAAGPDGRLYVLDALHGFAHVGGSTMHVFRRDGSYERTIKPFPADLPLERLKAAGAFRDQEGRTTPLIHLPSEHLSFYPGLDVQGQQMAVTPEGHLLMAVTPLKGNNPHLAILDSDGGVPCASYLGPVLTEEKLGYGHRLHAAAPFLAVGDDGQHVYLTGMGPFEYIKSQGSFARNSHAVFRVKLPERGPAEPFFGKISEAGGDERHLNDPQGLAVDGQGHLLVADGKNNRVVVLAEKNAAWVSSFPVPSPGWLGVDRRTGAVYVQSQGKLLKFSGWKEPKEVSAISLPAAGRARMSFALDASALPAVLWIGAGPSLFRCEDLRDKIGDAKTVCGPREAPRLFCLSADPLRREIMCMGGGILNEADGTVRGLSPKSLPGLRPSLGEWSGGYRLGRDNKVYLIAHSIPVVQFNSVTGQGIPFPSAAAQAAGGGLPGTLNRHGPGRGTHGLGVDRRGNIYVKHPVEGEKGECARWTISVFSPEGEFLRVGVHSVLGRGIVGPRADARGNIYIADAIHPPGRRYPEDFDAVFENAAKDWQKDLKGWYGDFIYGSIIKFGPAGGAIWPSVRKGDTWEPGRPPADFKADPAMKSENVQTWGRPALLQGAEWWRPGYSPQFQWGGGYQGCHCVYSDFDVDDFGRVFHPDQGRFRATVLDTNGNEILHFGGYGNQSACGPESYVFDPREKFYRPRRPDDPKDLKSPFAEPEIAFAWMTSMAVTDRSLYVSDHVNRRVLRVRLEYAATETVAVP